MKLCPSTVKFQTSRFTRTACMRRSRTFRQRGGGGGGGGGGGREREREERGERDRETERDREREGCVCVFFLYFVSFFLLCISKFCVDLCIKI